MAPRKQRRREPSPPSESDEEMQELPPHLRHNNDTTPDRDFPNIRFRDGLQKVKFLNLKRRGFRSTRFIDHDYMRTLGIESELRKLFTKVGMGEIYGFHCYTYPVIALEFLSSLIVIQAHKNKLVRKIQY